MPGMRLGSGDAVQGFCTDRRHGPSTADHAKYLELRLAHRHAEGVDRVEIHGYVNR